ncbi:unnamed protein product [Sphagnum balticum]
MLTSSILRIKERRQKEKATLRQEIIDQARKLFASDGYEAITMRKIAHRIRYSPTTIYLYFQNKEELVRAIADEDYANFAALLKQKAKHKNPIIQLKQIANAYIDFGLQHPDHYRLMFMTPFALLSEHQSELEEGNFQHDAYSFLVNTVQRAIEIRPASKTIDSHLIAQTFWAGLHGLVAQRISLGDEPWFKWRPISEAQQTLIEMMLESFFGKNDEARRPLKGKAVRKDRVNGSLV